jgi:predicted  nucleic acid-binding Zn-ribbon protein
MVLSPKSPSVMLSQQSDINLFMLAQLQALNQQFANQNVQANKADLEALQIRVANIEQRLEHVEGLMSSTVAVQNEHIAKTVLQPLQTRAAELDQKFNSIARSLATLDARLNTLDERLNALNARIRRPVRDASEEAPVDISQPISQVGYQHGTAYLLQRTGATAQTTFAESSASKYLLLPPQN